MASGKDSRTKVVLARKIGKQGLGGTPEFSPVLERNNKAELVTTEPFELAGGCHWLLLFLWTVAGLRTTVKMQGSHHHQAKTYQDTDQYSSHLTLTGIGNDN